MLFFKKGSRILVIFIIFLSLVSCNNESKVDDSDIFSNLAVENIKSITLATQMTENPPDKLIIKSKMKLNQY